ncbi:hypothetical protein MtrunA17_Chr2g0312761 [Medicago truncatula]|uniref:Uncharacterized protein n=1 Tax=Medicago truncatula TaxID=3880 RepID=A0A396J960_MEDTR|nr:hypothetical protein MtrunA17_Chr2g0312761 [Medicago truncatula]
MSKHKFKISPRTRNMVHTKVKIVYMSSQTHRSIFHISLYKRVPTFILCHSHTFLLLP